MKNSIFLNFLFLLLHKHKSKHLAIFFISILLLFMVSSVMFISNSLKNEVLKTFENQADFTVQRVKSGKIVDIPNLWAEDFLEINGISQMQQRVFGQYHFRPLDKYFTIVGVDFFEETTNKNLKNLFEKLDISSFLEKDNMLIGKGIRDILDKYFYEDTYTFNLEDNSKKSVKIFNVLPKTANLIANDLIIMDINLAKLILNIDENYSTDISFNVLNELERANIKNQLIQKHPNIRIIDKQILKKEYDNMFNYKGGIFLILFIVVLFTFILILYQRYSLINSNDKKEIAILKAVGWGIKNIIYLKLSENFFIAFISFLIGICLAFIYVFVLNAPLLKNIFLGFSNLENNIVLSLNIDLTTVFMLFLFFMIPFLSAILIPVWKIASIDVQESIK